MAGVKDSTKEKLKLLQESYLRQLPERLEEIDCCYEVLQNGYLDEEIIKNLYRIVHSIKGSSASFGFSEVSKSAQSLGKLLEHFDEHRMEAASETLSDVHAAIDMLRAAVADMTWHSAEKESGGSLLAVSEAAGESEENKLVYIVEDDASLLEEFSQTIRQFGYEGRGVGRFDGLEKAFSVKRPAAVILDSDMLDLGSGGPAAVLDIKHKLGGGVPVIFVSERDDISARLQAVRSGSDAYIVKPVNSTELADKLAALTTSKVSEPYKILVVDDEPELAQYHSLILQDAGMIAEIINEPMQVFNRLSEFNPDLILMDMYMPDCDGKELARTIRQMKAYFGIPIVFLSGETDRDKQLSAMVMGGDEFLTKPVKPEHLISSVAMRAERMRNIRSFMERDGLTGLLNHTSIMHALDVAVARARRLKTQVFFAMIDIDRFKTINDTYGHSVGDRVISSLSRLLQQRLRKTNVIGRYGGEEFAVILNETNAPYALKMLDTFRMSFSQIKFRHEGREFSVTFSAGLAAYPEFDCAESLSEAADKALYEAKRNGRNKVLIASK